MTMLFIALHESGIGTLRTCLAGQAMSAFSAKLARSAATAIMSTTPQAAA
jgi:hypothetical protein